MIVVNRERVRQAILLAAINVMQDPTIKVQATVVNLLEIKSAIDYLKVERFAEADAVLSAYFNSKVEPYLPVVNLNLVHCGVIIELTSDGLMILDGVHRAFAAFSRGCIMIHAYILDRGLQASPCKLRKLMDVKVGLPPGLPPTKSLTSEVTGAWRPSQTIINLATSYL